MHAEETTGFFVVSMIFLVNKRIAVQLEVNAKLGTQLVPSDQVYKHYFKHKFFDDGFCEFCPQTYASGWNFGLGLKVHESGTPDSEGYPSTTVVWGDNSWKQLRVPSFFNNTELLQVTAGRSHACGLRSGNILSCWGVEGDSSLYDKKGTPLISTNIKFVRVSAGAYHTCGIKLDGMFGVGVAIYTMSRGHRIVSIELFVRCTGKNGQHGQAMGHLFRSTLAFLTHVPSKLYQGE